MISGKWNIISEQPVNWLCHLFQMSPLKDKSPLFKTFRNVHFLCAKVGQRGNFHSQYLNLKSYQTEVRLPGRNAAIPLENSSKMQVALKSICWFFFTGYKMAPLGPAALSHLCRSRIIWKHRGVKQKQWIADWIACVGEIWWRKR